MREDAFALAKRNATSKVDFSRKGSVDEHARELLTVINDHPELFSLSSCSGRIVILEEETSSESKVQCIAK